MSLPRVLAAAIAVIQHEEACHLWAYPDPLSPLGKRIGHAGIIRIANGGQLAIGESIRAGEPWTIGWGTTGAGITYRTHWTQAQCDAALVDRAQVAHTHAARMYPGLDALHVNAQAAIVSLVYNRGQSLANTDKRSEMRALAPAIAARNYERIAELLRAMKRHWPNTGLVGRREREAVLVETQ